MEESIKKIKMDQWIYEDDDKATVRMNLLAITINLKSKDNLKFSKKLPKKQPPPKILKLDYLNILQCKN